MASWVKVFSPENKKGKIIKSTYEPMQAECIPICLEAISCLIEHFGKGSVGRGSVGKPVPMNAIGVRQKTASWTKVFHPKIRKVRL